MILIKKTAFIDRYTYVNIKLFIQSQHILSAVNIEESI